MPENKKSDLSKLSIDQLKSIAKAYVPELEKEDDNISLAEMDVEQDEFMEFLIAQKISVGKQEVPKDIIYYEYKKNKKIGEGIGYNDFMSRLNETFQKRRVKFDGKYTKVYKINWDGYIYTIETYRNALREVDTIRLKESRLRAKKKSLKEKDKQSKKEETV